VHTGIDGTDGEADPGRTDRDRSPLLAFESRRQQSLRAPRVTATEFDARDGRTGEHAALLRDEDEQEAARQERGHTDEDEQRPTDD